MLILGLQLANLIGQATPDFTLAELFSMFPFLFGCAEIKQHKTSSFVYYIYDGASKYEYCIQLYTMIEL